ncbi:MAG: hypothetical protein ABFS43_10870 [Thermodesulfobacteriota bacterium]
MEKVTRKKIHVLLALVLISLLFLNSAEARVKKEGGKIFIVDRTGEQWDITQAVSMGFDPYKFEFGIGRNAFEPLDEDDWQSGEGHDLSDMRIIGVVEDEEAHAYSVNRLRYHETANTFLGNEAIVAGY